jgi:hypothetical protein
MFLFEKKWRLKVCPHYIEVFVHTNPENDVKAEM